MTFFVFAWTLTQQTNPEKYLVEINRGNALTDYGIRNDNARTQYDVDTNEFNAMRQQEMDIYGRDQTELDRLSNLAGSGQNAAVQLGGFGAQNTDNALASTQYESNTLNNAINAGLSQLQDYLNRNGRQGPTMGPDDWTDSNGYGVG